MPAVQPKSLRKAHDAQSTSTRCIVRFYTWSENGFAGSTDSLSAKQILGTPQSVSHSKAFGSASGSFTITMKRPQVSGDKRITEYAYQKIWQEPEGVWIFVQWFCDGTLIDGFFGCCDNINRDTSRGESGTRTETYEIHGRDFGKVFEDTILFVNPKSPIPIASYAFIVETLKPSYENNTPAEFVTRLIEAWLGNQKNAAQAWELPPGLKGKGETFFQMLSLAGIQTMNRAQHGCTSSPRLINPEQDGTNLWDMLQHYSNGVLNELWVDLATPPSRNSPHTGLVPTVFLRERPFPTQDNGGAFWKRLRTWRLDREDIKDSQVAKGGSAARFNYWLLYPAGYGMPEMSGFMQQGAYPVDTGKPGSIPIVNLQSIRRFGLRKWEETSIFGPSNLSSDITNDPAATRTGIATEQWRQLMASWLKKLHDWHAVVPRQLSGRLTLSRLFPEIRIGHRIFESTDAGGGIYYYVEGVEHSWQYPGSGATVLTVTRGEYAEDDNLASIYATYEGQATFANVTGAATVKDSLDVEGHDPSMIDNLGD